MSKGDNNTIIIDLDKWTTQAIKAANYASKNGKGCSIQYINRLISEGKLQALRIEKLNLVLVEK